MTDTNEKLVELLKGAILDCEPVRTCFVCPHRAKIDCKARRAADNLIANGVIVNANPASNADNIRGMTNEELLVFLIQFQYEVENRFASFRAVDHDKLEEWLKQPVKEE